MNLLKNYDIWLFLVPNAEETWSFVKVSLFQLVRAPLWPPFPFSALSSLHTDLKPALRNQFIRFGSSNMMC